MMGLPATSDFELKNCKNIFLIGFVSCRAIMLEVGDYSESYK